MKKIIVALLLFVGIAAHGQTKYVIRADSVVFEKVGGNSEFNLYNSTRNTKGVLTNIGGGRTRFVKSRVSGDTLFVGVDTLISGIKINNLGSSFRLWSPTAPGIKTLAGGFGFVWDSLTANTITGKVDTAIGTGVFPWTHWLKVRDSIDLVYTPMTRTISTGYGWTGGGNLSANRTFIADTAVGSGLFSWPRWLKVRDSLNLATKGIDDVLAVGQALTDDRSIDGGGHEFQIYDAPLIGLYGISGSSTSTIEASGASVALEGSNGGHQSQMTLSSDSIVIRPEAGILKIDSLQTTTDTTNYKPTVWNKATGSFRAFTSWPGGSGGGGGGTIGGSIATNQIAVGSGTNTIAGASTFTWNGQTLMLGDFTPTGSSTPVTMNSGATYGTAPPGTPGNLKWRLYDDNAGSTYGFGISNGVLEYQSGATASHVFYNNGTEAFRIGSAGTISVGSSQSFQVNSSGKNVKYGGTTPTDGELLIGHTANGTFEKTTLTPGAGISVTNGAGSITVASTNTYGEYTPTFTTGTNVSSVTLVRAYYSRQGDYVTVDVRASVAWTSTSSTSQFAISLPVASNLAGTTALGQGTIAPGTVFFPATGGYVVDDATNDRVDFKFTSPSIGSPGNCDIHIVYKVI